MKTLRESLRMRIDFLNFSIVFLTWMNHQMMCNRHYSFRFNSDFRRLIKIIQSHRNRSFYRVLQRNNRFIHFIILNRQKAI